MSHSVGDRVRMLAGHAYSHQGMYKNKELCEGEILRVSVTEWKGYDGKGNVTYRVRWDNGVENSYTDCHIESVMPMTNKDAKRLLAKR